MRNANVRNDLKMQCIDTKCDFLSELKFALAVVVNQGPPKSTQAPSPYTSNTK